eukprot:scaffold232115_cov21-Tisochrysis_lutea.AAC.1
MAGAACIAHTQQYMHARMQKACSAATRVGLAWPFPTASLVTLPLFIMPDNFCLVWESTIAFSGMRSAIKLSWLYADNGKELQGVARYQECSMGSLLLHSMGSAAIAAWGHCQCSMGAGPLQHWGGRALACTGHICSNGSNVF